MINVRQEAHQYISDLLSKPKVPLVNLLRSDFSLPAFIPPPNDELGFGPVLSRVEESRPGWVTWRCAMPACKKKFEIDWNRLYAISATLNVLTTSLSIFDGKTEEVKPQLICVRITTMHGPHGGSLSADLSKALLPWLSSQPDNSRNIDIQTTMRNTYERLSKYKVPSLSFGRFDAMMRQPHWVNLSCPGDACGLDPEDYYTRDGRGYKLLPHNVDSPVQQLTLLMGLAVMHDQARKAGY